MFCDRVQIVLLEHRGRQQQHNAADVCINRRSMQPRLITYLVGGLNGLRPRKAKRHAGNIRVDWPTRSAAGSSQV